MKRERVRMVIGLLFPAVLAALGAFGLALLWGMAFWAALLVYAATGSLTVLLMGCRLALCHRSRGAMGCDQHDPVLVPGNGR